MKTIHVGMKVEVANFGVGAPIHYNTSPNGTRCDKGEIVEVLSHGFAVKFDGYPNVWDYSQAEARFFRQRI